VSIGKILLIITMSFASVSDDRLERPVLLRRFESVLFQLDTRSIAGYGLN
jgi:hypothetical protein